MRSRPHIIAVRYSYGFVNEVVIRSKCTDGALVERLHGSGTVWSCQALANEAANEIERVYLRTRI